MQLLPLLIFIYLIFHAYVLQLYQYIGLSYQTYHILSLQLYLIFRKQSQSYIISSVPEANNFKGKYSQDFASSNNNNNRNIQNIQNNNNNRNIQSNNNNRNIQNNNRNQKQNNFRKQQNEQKIAQEKQGKVHKQQQQLRICEICKNYKPRRYYHCRRCNRCIFKMDHHCQWISNCVGQYNMKTYLHFLIQLLVNNFIVLTYVVAYNFSQIINNQQRSIYLLILVLPSLLIIFQTQRLLRDFYWMVKVNQTLVESYKNVRGKSQSFIANLNHFLGSRNMIFWFIPFYIPSIQKPPVVSQLKQKTVNQFSNSINIEQFTYADEYIYGKDDESIIFQTETKITKIE